MRTRLQFNRICSGMVKWGHDPVDLGQFYVCGRAVEHDMSEFFITYASTRVPQEEWERFIATMRTKYGSLTLHRSPEYQLFKFEDEADEAAFIMESVDWIDV